MSAFALSEPILREPRLAEIAIDARPVWLFSPDGGTLFFANPAGAPYFGSGQVGGAVRSQIAQIAGRLAPGAQGRLERLRGFGGGIASLRTCLCTRIALGGTQAAILVMALDAERGAPSLDKQLATLIGDSRDLFAFHDDGTLAYASDAARPRFGALVPLDQNGLGGAFMMARKNGHGEATSAQGLVEFFRLGTQKQGVIVARLMSLAASQDAAETPGTQPGAATTTALVDVVAKPAIDEPAADNTAAPAASDTDRAANENVAAEAEASAVDRIGETTTHAPPEELEPVAQEFAASNVDETDEPNNVPVQDMSEAQAAPVTPAPRVPTQEVEHEEAETAQPAPAMFPPVLCEAAAIPLSNAPYRHPLRFMWQTDASERFALGSDEFSRLVGPLAMAAFGRPWAEINHLFDVDPTDRIARALATHDTWSGIVVQWPFDDGRERLAVEMSGLPAFDRERNFLGYRGFGVCRDLDGLNRLASTRKSVPRAPETFSERPASVTPDASADHLRAPPSAPDLTNPTTRIAPENKPDQMQQEPPANVVPFRPSGEARGPVPSLSPNENSAFNELARQLSERLTTPGTIKNEATPVQSDEPAIVETDDMNAGDETRADTTQSNAPMLPAGNDDEVPSAQPHPFGTAPVPRPLLERLPVGVLVYRLDRLLFANRAFLEFCGFETLDELNESGGLDALFVEPVAGADQQGDGKALRIATGKDGETPVEAKLYSVQWSDESALALVMMPARMAPAVQVQAPAPTSAPTPALAPASEKATALAELLDLSADAVFTLGDDTTIVGCNRTLEQWSGRRRDALIGTSFLDCLSHDSRAAAERALEAARNRNVTPLPRKDGDGIGVSIVGPDGTMRPAALVLQASQALPGTLNGALRDQSAQRESTKALRAAESEATRAQGARNGLLARISHEIRAPLNAIIGFANVMIDGKFGAIENERYGAYLKDIRDSGENVVGLIDNLLDLSHIETGKAEFRFADVLLNDLVEHCVALMQPQANRNRIIIRTSLTHNLPNVHADPRALRQVIMNLLSHSVALSQPGGQVIISTALGDAGDVFLRVRDSGPAMSDADIARALDPFGPYQAGDALGPRQNGLSLPLTRALAEANKARFSISAGAHGHGTLVEIVFARPHARVS